MAQELQANPVSENPYNNIDAINTPEMLPTFHGRKEQLKRLYRNLAKRQSVSVIGPLQIGKSSFLWCACQPEMYERFDENLSRHVFVLVDLRESVYRSAERFLHYVSQAIVRQVKAQGVKLSLPKGDGADAFLNVLDQVLEKGYALVLALDSFDSITRNEHFGPEFFSLLRSQGSSHKVTYVTASIAPLYVLCHKGIVDSPFFNIFDEQALAEFTREEAECFIRKPAEDAHMPFSDEEVEWIIKHAGLHPCFILRACSALFDLKLQSPRHSVSEQQFRNKASSILAPYFIAVWERLSEQDMTAIRDIVQQKKYLERTAKPEHAGLQDEPKQKYSELTESAFFRQFVREKNKIGVFKMNADELEKALKKMHNLAALGETNLRLMKSVARRLEDNASPTPVERGKVIRSVLDDALEHLRGKGMRKDTDQEWMYYNILSYRYFTRFSLKHREIATRLEFTNDRQYYRKRNNAVAALLNVLFEMEGL